MAWTAIASTQTDADSPIDQTLTDAIRTNLDDLNTRVSAIASVSDHDIRDDFVGGFNGSAGTTTSTWFYQNGANGSVAAGAAPDHYLRFTTTAGAAGTMWVSMRSSTYRMVFDLTRSFDVTMEWRHKSQQSQVTQIWAMGFQDTTLWTGAFTDVTDQTDFIGFIQGNANTYTAITASGGVTTTVASNQGAAANWTDLKIVITGGTSVEFFVGGASVGTSTTNITGAELRPFFGFSTGGTWYQDIDYVLAYFGSRPESA